MVVKARERKLLFSWKIKVERKSKVSCNQIACGGGGGGGGEIFLHLSEKSRVVGREKSEFED